MQLDADLQQTTASVLTSTSLTTGYFWTGMQQLPNKQDTQSSTWADLAQRSYLVREDMQLGACDHSIRGGLATLLGLQMQAWSPSRQGHRLALLQDRRQKSLQAENGWSTGLFVEAGISNMTLSAKQRMNDASRRKLPICSKFITCPSHSHLLHQHIMRPMGSSSLSLD